MRGSGSWHIAAALIFTLGLSACNTTDALTPRVDIGDTGSSSPVTQADTDRMAGAYSEPIQSAPLASTANTDAPRNTLEAQADALNNGSMVSPSSSGPPPDWSGQSTAQQAPLSTHGADPAQSSALQASPSPASANTIRFLPIIGAPVEAVTPLSRQLAVAARSGGLTIRPSGDNGTEHILGGRSLGSNPTFPHAGGCGQDDKRVSRVERAGSKAVIGGYFGLQVTVRS